MALHAACVLDAADALEAESVPDAAAGDVGLVDEVEHAGLEAQQRGPLEVVAAHDTAAAGAAVVQADEEAGVADVRRAADVVGLDVEAAEELVGASSGDVEVGAEPVLLRHGAPDHHGDKVREVVLVELRPRERVLVHVRRALLDDCVEQRVDGVDDVRRRLLERVVREDRHRRAVSKLVVERLRDEAVFFDNHCLLGGPGGSWWQPAASWTVPQTVVPGACCRLLMSLRPSPCVPQTVLARSGAWQSTRSVSAFPLSARNAYLQRLGLAGRPTTAGYMLLATMNRCRAVTALKTVTALQLAIPRPIFCCNLCLLRAHAPCPCPYLPPHLAGPPARRPKPLSRHDFRYRIE